MNKEILDKLKGNKTLDDLPLNELISTGSYALNRIISGDYKVGCPIGAILQLRGESSTGKTLFATAILKEAQKLGYFTKLIDAENSFNKVFAESLGIDAGNLLYSAPETLEEAFQDVEDTVTSIRALDKKTPIVIAIDSLAVLPIEKELHDPKAKEGDNKYTIKETDGAIRAKIMGACLRKVNFILRKEKVALIVINQVRTKLNVMYGDPSTNAAGGKSLDFYLAVDLKLTSNKTSDVLRTEDEVPYGIKGKIDVRKNKVSIPFQSCDFEVLFNKGLTSLYGLVDLLAKDKLITMTSPGRYCLGDFKFTERQFNEMIGDPKVKELDSIRVKLGILN